MADTHRAGQVVTFRMQSRTVYNAYGVGWLQRAPKMRDVEMKGDSGVIVIPATALLLLYSELTSIHFTAYNTKSKYAQHGICIRPCNTSIKQNFYCYMTLSSLLNF
jgi:hypothetical protein